MSMTEQERAALKAELMQELREEMNAKTVRDKSTKCLQPVLDKWCNGDRRPHGGVMPCNGPMIEAMPKFKGWDAWDKIRRLTCDILDVSYVRDIVDTDRARKIADRLCEVVTELAREEI